MFISLHFPFNTITITSKFMHGIGYLFLVDHIIFFKSVHMQQWPFRFYPDHRRMLACVMWQYVPWYIKKIYKKDIKN